MNSLGMNSINQKLPLIWTHLPNKIPYNLGLLLQETLVLNRLNARSLLTSIKANPTLSNNYTQRQLTSLKRTAKQDILLLLEHTPVFTAGRREKDLVQTKLEGERLTKLGSDYVVTMRGGQTTYHGPGQLVGYSIMDLANADLSTRCYVNKMETFLSKLTTSLSVPVHPLPHTGVFTSPTQKIGSIGIHMRHRITLHGFSLNIKEEVLNWFNNIIACGLDEVKATSVESELRRLGLDTDGVVEVKDVIGKTVKGFGEAYGREMIELGSSEEDDELRKVIEDGVAGRLPPLPQ